MLVLSEDATGGLRGRGGGRKEGEEWEVLAHVLDER